jgi:hypothetical protein
MNPLLPRERLLVFLVVLTLPAVAAGLSWCKHTPQGRVQSTSVPVYRFHAGQRLVYKFRYACAGAMEANAAFANPPQANSEPTWVSISGELVVTVLKSEAEQLRATFSLRHPSVRTKHSAEDPPVALVQQELTSDVHVAMDQLGRIRTMRVEPTVCESTRQCIRMIAAAMQFIVPDGIANANAWEAREETPDGPFHVRYTAGSAPGTIVKTRTRPLAAPRKPGPRSVIRRPNLQPDGHVECTFDSREGRIQSLQGNEGLSVVLGGQTVARRQSNFSIDLSAVEWVSPAELENLRQSWIAREAVNAAPMAWRESSVARQTAEYREILGDSSAESLLSELQNAEDHPSKLEDNGLEHKFRALAVLRPEACAQLGRALEGAAAHGPMFAVLLRTLCQAGHPEAQTALANVIRARRSDWAALAQLIPALGMVESPAPVAEEVLRELASTPADWNVRSTAQLALGIVSANLKTVAPKRAASIVDWALEEWRIADTPASRRQILLVLGNAGDSRALPAMRTALEDSATEVRAAAAYGLRWMDAAEAEARLIRVLNSDADVSVRSAAADALMLRPPTQPVVAAAGTSLGADSSPGVRLILVRLLWEAREDFPEAIRAVERAAETDASPEVRDLAASLLSPDTP